MKKEVLLRGGPADGRVIFEPDPLDIPLPKFPMESNDEAVYRSTGRHDENGREIYEYVGSQTHDH